MGVSFKKDIQPFFGKYQGEMMWRFDVTNYDDMKANAQAVYDRISSSEAPMPPVPFPPFPDEVIKNFKLWMDNGFPL